MINVLLSDFYDEVARNEPAELLFIFENLILPKQIGGGAGI